MPDPTTNYGWDLPNVGGDTGAWGTILNAVLDAIDAQVKEIDDRTVGLFGDVLISAVSGVEAWESGSSATQWWFSGAGTRVRNSPDSNAHRLYFRLSNLPVGQVLSAIRSYGNVFGGAVCTVALVRVEQNGVETVVSAGHTLPGSETETETTGIAHTILADNDYYIRLLVTEPASSGLTSIRSVGYTVEAAP